MKEVKIMSMVVLLVVFFIVSLALTSYVLNNKDWEAERINTELCVRKGGAYIDRDNLRGCFTLLQED